MADNKRLRIAVTGYGAIGKRVVYYAYMVDNQAIVIPENIDAVRALSGFETEACASIRKTDAALGVHGGRCAEF